MATDAKSWPELVANLYNKLRGREDEIIYEFEDFELHVPRSTSENARHTQWKMNGTLKVRPQDREDQQT